MVDEDFRAYMMTLIPGIPVQEAFIAADKDLPTRVWFGLSSSQYEVLLDGSPLANTYTFNVEVHSLSISTAQATARTLRRGLHAQRLGNKPGVLVVWVDDQDDDYQYRGLSADDGYEVSALSVRIIVAED